MCMCKYITKIHCLPHHDIIFGMAIKKTSAVSAGWKSHALSSESDEGGFRPQNAMGAGPMGPTGMELI